MKLLIMGAGYVGMTFLKSLNCPSFELYVTTTQEQRIEELKPYVKEVLWLSPNKVQEFHNMIANCDAMVILVAPQSHKDYAKTYLETAKMVNTAIEGRTKPFYLLYTSSTSVCEGQEGWVTEDMSLQPESPKAQILLETEKCYLSCNANVCILRLGGIYGPGRELGKRAMRFSGQTVSGNGTEPTNHIHLDDIVAAIKHCLNHSLTGLYHLVNDTHVSRRELYAKLCISLQIPQPIWQDSTASKGYKISNHKIKSTGFVFIQKLISLG